MAEAIITVNETIKAIKVNIATNTKSSEKARIIPIKLIETPSMKISAI